VFGVTSYDVAGFRLRVHGDDGAPPLSPMLAPVEAILGRFRADWGGDEGAWSLSIGRRERQSVDADGLRTVWQGLNPARLHVVTAAAAGRRRCDIAGIGTLHVDTLRRQAAIALLPDAPPHTVHYFLPAILFDGLIAAGHCLVHAACLERVGGASRRTVLIVAKSGTGKSTTALAMTDVGWRLMGDDIAVITRTPDGLQAWGFPRFCNVRRPTLALLPWLAELPLVPTTVPETFALPLEELGPRVCQGIPAPAPAAAVVCLEPPNRVGHRLASLDRAAALLHIAEENVQPVEGSGDAAARRSFETLAHFVRTTPAYSLSVGPRVERIGAVLAEQLCL
jgi:hypothetical protein